MIKYKVNLTYKLMKKPVDYREFVIVILPAIIKVTNSIRRLI